MSYNFELSLNENNSVGDILKHITAQSKVLEFGCAHGRMTAYMKDVLKCEVYIVEYDSDGFEDAMQYAADGLCDDILNYKWVEHFANIQFDYIIFADVLEHLYNPIEVLQKTKILLKDTGSVLVSVPNLAHNDIVANLFYNQFEYTQYGLLDNTHIRFFADGMLEEFCTRAGYTLVEKGATFVDTGCTEQAKLQEFELSSFMKNLLDSRKNGTVYQYILRLQKSEYAKSVCKSLELNEKQPLYIKVYYRGEDDFSEEKISRHMVERLGGGKYKAKLALEIARDINIVRIDPVEGQPCIIENFEVHVEQGSVNCSLVDYMEQGIPVLLNSNDPQIICDVTAVHMGSMEVTFDFYLMGVTYFEKLHEIIDKIANM